MPPRSTVTPRRAFAFTTLLALVGLGACAPASARSQVAGTPSDAAAPGAARAELVTTAATSPSHRGGSRTVVVAAPVEIVREVLADPASYATLLPRVRALDVLSTEPDGSLIVRVEHGLVLVRGSYVVRFSRPTDARFTFDVDHRYPSDVPEAGGSFELRALDARTTEVRFALDFDLGGGAIDLLFGARIERAAMSVPDRLRAFAENRAGAR